MSRRYVLVESAAQVESALDSAIQWLTHVRADYLRDRELEPGVRTARVAALTAKIDALRAVTLNPWAYPWSEDWTTPTQETT